jgi:tetratricopeptide (TPR) repeat protein
MHRTSLTCLHALAFVFLTVVAPGVKAQNSTSAQLQVEPPMRRAEAPPADAPFEELLKRGDELRAAKAYLDALDYYHAALAKKPNNASVYNRIGIAELQIQRWKEARRDFERAIKADRTFADAYNNLGVVEYEQKKYRSAIKQYELAIKIRDDAASYYSNLGAAYFSKKDYEHAATAYAKALQLDPEVFERNSRTGVSAQLPSPEDRARYEYVMAKLYAKAGVNDRSLEHLRRAMEEGYKTIDDVYKDAEFSELRKDPRFTQLMAAKPLAIPQ